MIKIKLILFFILFILFFNCQNKIKQNKEIIILIGCDEIEVKSDIEYSINNLEHYLNSNNIKITFKEDEQNCGYILIYNSKQKKIEYAMTDVDLLEICKNFYKE